MKKSRAGNLRHLIIGEIQKFPSTSDCKSNYFINSFNPILTEAFAEALFIAGKNCILSFYIF